MPDNLDLPNSGSIFIGEEGNMVLAHVAGPRLYPLEKFTGFKYPKEQGLSHWHRWVDACLGGPKVFSDFDFGGHLTEIGLSGIVALRLQKSIDWDGPNMKVPGMPEADKFIRKDRLFAYAFAAIVVVLLAVGIAIAGALVGVLLLFAGGVYLLLALLGRIVAVPLLYHPDYGASAPPRHCRIRKCAS
mgnify:CR=1 FL=1